MRTMARAVGAAAVCSALGCPGAQVRSPPPPEPCPVGAVKAMEKWGIKLGDKHEAALSSVRGTSPSRKVQAS